VLHSTRAFAARCHVQPPVPCVSEGRSLLVARSLPGKPCPSSRAGCFMLMAAGFVGSLDGRSTPGRRQRLPAELGLGAARDCCGGWRLNSSRGGGLEWDFSSHAHCCWFCCQLMLAKCKSCQGSRWAVLAATNPRCVEVCCPGPFPPTL